MRLSGAGRLEPLQPAGAARMQYSTRGVVMAQLGSMAASWNGGR